MNSYLVGVDIGGSFTDVIASNLETGALHYAKAPTIPNDLVSGIREALGALDIPFSEISVLRHGTTIVINSILTATGSTTALLTTQGFRDVLEIGRTNWAEPYNLFFDRLPPLVRRELRFDVPERMGADGQVVRELDESKLREILEKIESQGVESIAICFLHSYRNPEHEREAYRIVTERLPDAYVSMSHELSREFREFERTSTVVMNAYVGKTVDKYLGELEVHLRENNFSGELYLMESNGGVTSPATARRQPIVMVESGPASGVMATVEIAKLHNENRLIAFDMGGTTAKACIVESKEPLFTTEYFIPNYEHGYSVQVAALDIVEVGTGGGSIAAVDGVGMLTVGPESAGAVPGPACYGRGGMRATVTDANLLLGRLNPRRFLGGDIQLDVKAASEVIGDLATRLDRDAASMAQGIITIANLSMASAIKRVSLERGRDPREFALVAYGGAGPLHACDLARILNIPRVIIPVLPGMFSAVGMLIAELRHDVTHTLMRDLDELTSLDLRNAIREVGSSMNQLRMGEAKNANSGGSERILYYADCRYRGQEHTIMVPFDDPEGNGATERLRESFEHEYRLRYGHSYSELSVELVNVRAAVYETLDKSDIRTLTDSKAAAVGPLSPVMRDLYVDGVGYQSAPVVERSELPIGVSYKGPLVIEEYGSTTIVGIDDVVVVDETGQLVIDVGGIGPRLDAKNLIVTDSESS